MRRIGTYGLPLILGTICLEAFAAGQQIEVTIPGIADPGVLSVEGIGAEIGVVETLQPDGSTSKDPGLVDAGQLVLTRDFTGSPDYIDWVNEVSDAAAVASGIIHRDIACRQRIGAGTGLHVVYLDAFPIAYGGPDLGKGTIALESLTCTYDAVFTLLAPDPFKIKRVAMDSGELIIEWVGDISDGQFLFAGSPAAPRDEWSPVAPSGLSQDGTSGWARIPLSWFPGNRFFFRVEKP